MSSSGSPGQNDSYWTNLGGSSEGLAERRPPGGVLQAGILHGLCSARETVTLDGMWSTKCVSSDRFSVERTVCKKYYGEGWAILCTKQRSNDLIMSYIIYHLFRCYKFRWKKNLERLFRWNFSDSPNSHWNQIIENFRCEKFSVGHFSTEIISHRNLS